jgi:exportin-2 (importin alpha re-exporter)
VYTGIILPNTQKLSKFYDKKIAVVGLTKALSDSQAFVDRSVVLPRSLRMEINASSRYTKGWALTCEALLRLLIDPPVLTAHDDVIQDADADDPSFGVGFTQLNTCRKPVRDPYPEASDVKAWVGAYLKDADSRHGGRIGKFVAERLNDQQRGVLTGLMS